jgi:hypothetical protein
MEAFENKIKSKKKVVTKKKIVKKTVKKLQPNRLDNFMK